MRKRTDGRIDRRSVLKGLGVGAVVIGGATGTASAHHVQDIELENVPETVIAGEPFSFKVHWQAGHGSDACFVSAVDDGNWVKCGEANATASYPGEHLHFTMSSTVPRSTSPGEHTFRCSAAEAYHRCPHPGECSYPIKCAEAPNGGTIEVKPPVEVQDVAFRGCSEVWVAFDAFPVDSTTAHVNVNGSWQPVTINKSELTKIPGQYGHDTPVYKHSVSGNDKLVGLRIVGEEYTNDHRCAQNV